MYKKFKYNDPNAVNPTEKFCYKCHIKKDLINFNKCKTGVYGYHNQCRDCQKITKKNWDDKNRDWIKEYMDDDETREKQRISHSYKYKHDIEWRNKHLELNRTRRRGEAAKAKAKEQRKKWTEIPHNRISVSLRGRLRAAFNGICKSASTEALIGCSFELAKKHIESLFKDGMSWDNYGEWHIDHIIPCSYFDLNIEENQKIAFNYLNLQPLWEKDNISKNNKILIDDLEGFINKIKANITVN